VKLVYDTRAKDQVALKILQPKYAFSAKKEIDILKELDHPNIIHIYECFDNVLWQKRKTTVFAIEYADGGELIEYLMYTAKFEPPLARWFFKKLVAGVEYCHKQDVVHRDLNIFATPSEVKALVPSGAHPKPSPLPDKSSTQKKKMSRNSLTSSLENFASAAALRSTANPSRLLSSSKVRISCRKTQKVI